MSICECSVQISHGSYNEEMNICSDNSNINNCNSFCNNSLLIIFNQLLYTVCQHTNYSFISVIILSNPANQK